VAALLIVGVSLVSASTVEFRSAINQSHSTQAFYVAEAGLRWARRGLVQGTLTLPAGLSLNQPHFFHPNPVAGLTNANLAAIGVHEITVTRIAVGRWELRSTGLQHQARRTVSWQITELPLASNLSVPERHRIRDNFHRHSHFTGGEDVIKGSAGFTFPAVNLPPVPTGLSDRGDLTVNNATVITASGHYRSITVSGPLTISPRDTDLVIVVNTLEVRGDRSIEIDRSDTGTGRVIIHVINSITLDGTIGSQDTVNRLQVLHHGSSDVNIRSRSTFHGSLLTNNASIRIDNSAGVSGNLLTNSTETDAIRIRNYAIVGTATQGVLIYAPRGSVEIDNRSNVFGVVVARNLNGGNHATLTLNRNINTPLAPFISFGGGVTYTFSDWNVRR